jgi:phosphoglycerate kinase
VQLHLPVDAIIADKFDADADSKICLIHEIPDGWMGLDIGPKSVQLFTDIIKKCKTILWNGPQEFLSSKKFANGTKAIAETIAETTATGAFSLIGGGDSAAAINKFHLGDKVSYVSTGGGALLEYFEGKVLPGVAAINE